MKKLLKFGIVSLSLTTLGVVGQLTEFPAFGTQVVRAEDSVAETTVADANTQSARDLTVICYDIEDMSTILEETISINEGETRTIEAPAIDGYTLSESSDGISGSPSLTISYDMAKDAIDPIVAFYYKKAANTQTPPVEEGLENQAKTLRISYEVHPMLGGEVFDNEEVILHPGESYEVVVKEYDGFTSYDSTQTYHYDEIFDNFSTTVYYRPQFNPQDPATHVKVISIAYMHKDRRGGEGSFYTLKPGEVWELDSAIYSLPENSNLEKISGPDRITYEEALDGGFYDIVFRTKQSTSPAGDGTQISPEERKEDKIISVDLVSKTEDGTVLETITRELILNSGPGTFGWSYSYKDRANHIAGYRLSHYNRHEVTYDEVQNGDRIVLEAIFKPVDPNKLDEDALTFTVVPYDTNLKPLPLEPKTVTIYPGEIFYPNVTNSPVFPGYEFRGEAPVTHTYYDKVKEAIAERGSYSFGVLYSPVESSLTDGSIEGGGETETPPTDKPADGDKTETPVPTPAPETPQDPSAKEMAAVITEIENLVTELVSLGGTPRHYLPEVIEKVKAGDVQVYKAYDFANIKAGLLEQIAEAKKVTETPAPTPAPETPEERQARINHNLRVLRSEVERVDRALTYPKLTPAEVAALEAFKAKRLETIASLEQTGELGDDNLTEADIKAFDKVLALELAGVFNDKDADQPISTPAPKDLAADRNKLLLSVDESGLTEQQKGELAIKITFAETEKDLADLKAELVKLVKAAEKPANKPAKEAPKAESKAPAAAAKPAANAPAKSDKAALPATGDVTRVGLIAAGFSLLLLGLGLAKSRKHN